MQFFGSSEISPSPPVPTASGNNAHMMYVFNRNGVCLLYREWNRPLRTLDSNQDHKLMLLQGFSITDKEETEETEKEIIAGKKEYPIDVSLPDINDGVYGTDEFRMYMFKVKPCSRAYSHDWTECPFVHPGENARRRDPRKHQYSCVPCPEFRKGSCVKGDNCEYAHVVFESWLHRAQYRTRRDEQTSIQCWESLNTEECKRNGQEEEEEPILTKKSKLVELTG